ncbi:MAG: hypothetical protein ACRD2N_01055 [Vicinamibacterales bacterium]
MAEPAGQARGWTLFFVAWAIVAAFTRTSATSSHEWSRLGTIDSIVQRGSYELETSRFHGTTDKIFFNGHYYSHQPPLLPTLEAPIYWILRQLGLQFWNSAPFDLAYYLFTILTNGAAFAFTVVLFDRVLGLAGIRWRWRVAAALLLPFGTWLFPYALVTNNHGMSAMALAWVTYLLLVISLRGATLARASLLGLSLGLISAIEVVPLVSFVPLACVFVATRSDMHGPRSLLAFTLGLLTPLAAHAVLNLPLTGDLLPGGFHTELFNYPGSRFTPDTLTGQFNHPSIGAFLDYGWRALVSEKGYFTYAPVLLIGLVGAFLGLRRWGEARGAYRVLLWGSTVSLVVSLLMTNNLGGVAVGFRHSVFICPALLALLAPVFADSSAASRAAKTIAHVVAGISVVALLVFAVPQPWSQLRIPPDVTSVSWRQYVPVIAYVRDRLNGTVDEFGKPR